MIVNIVREIKRLLQKTYNIFKSDGVYRVFVEMGHCIKSVMQKITGDFLYPRKASADVLFITCSPQGIKDAPTRYRVFFQKEQLEESNVLVDVMYYANLKKEDIDRYDFFIFHRVPYLDTLRDCIITAKQQNKMVIYDIDDLIFEKTLLIDKHEVKEMSSSDKEQYFNGVDRSLQLMKLCDYGIASTEVIATHMRKYIKTVFVHRNGISHKLQDYSQHALQHKTQSNKIVFGYFSGSATHNDDLQMIAQPIASILRKNKNVNLLLVGPVKLPQELKEFSTQIKYHQFVSWQKLPQLIASIDINLVPLTNTLFNNAKSEIKYTETSLVHVPTIASDVDAFRTVIQHKVNGFIAKNDNDWIAYMQILIDDGEQRKKIGNNAYNNVVDLYNVKKMGKKIVHFLQQHRAKKIVYIIPTTNISGGVMVVAQHVQRLQKLGYNTLLVSCGPSDVLSWLDDFSVPTIKLDVFTKNQYTQFLDVAVATLWSTLRYVSDSYAKQKFYFVQNREYDFYAKDNPLYQKAKKTYNNHDVDFFTMSRWCQKWLLDDFDQKAKYIPNGIDIELFCPEGEAIASKSEDKTRILIEGNPDDAYKNVDESFEIVNKLNTKLYEVWFISYGGKPKNWYRYDRFFQRVPYTDMPKYYRSCNIFLKTSKLESFSYPPLEMMACGGVTVVAENEGNRAYIKNHYNTLSYTIGDTDTAVKHIQRMSRDIQMREKMITHGLKTAQEWNWDHVIKTLIDILF